LMEELGIECLVGHPAEIRAAEPRKQKQGHLLLSLLVEESLSAIWVPTKETADLVRPQVESDLSPIAAEYRPISACLTQNKTKRANKIVFLRLIRDQELEGSNPFRPDQFFLVTLTARPGSKMNPFQDYLAPIADLVGDLPQN